MYSAVIDHEDRKQLLERRHILLGHEGVAEEGEAGVRAAWRELEQVDRALERIEAIRQSAKSAPVQPATRNN